MRVRFLTAAIVAVLFITAPASVNACPFCVSQGTTLAQEVASADFILYGTLSNAIPSGNGFGGGTTDLTIELTIKPHDVVKGKKLITLPRYVPPVNKNEKVKFLIFFNYNPADGSIDPYRGESVSADSQLPDYLKGAIEVRGKDAATRLQYFFNHLEDKDSVISTDAYSEFAMADYKEIRAAAAKLSGAKLLTWLKDPNTRPTRYGLYGLLIGHCGKAEDAKAIRAVLDDPERSFSSGLDGLATGYIMLDPKAGWDYLNGMIKDASKDFPIRYAGLKTIRFFWEFRPDLITPPQVIAAMKILMEQGDLADLPIEDLRKWKVWEVSPVVLAYAEKESHNQYPIVNRAILKYAIAASAADPKNTAAAEFVKKAREKDAKKVEFLEELIKDEAKSAVGPNTTGGNP